eukprot:1189648-Prorocentrum_minimum.AAC.4
MGPHLAPNSIELPQSQPLRQLNVQSREQLTRNASKKPRLAHKTQYAPLYFSYIAFVRKYINTIPSQAEVTRPSWSIQVQMVGDSYTPSVAFPPVFPLCITWYFLWRAMKLIFDTNLGKVSHDFTLIRENKELPVR